MPSQGSLLTQYPQHTKALYSPSHKDKNETSIQERKKKNPAILETEISIKLSQHSPAGHRNLRAAQPQYHPAPRSPGWGPGQLLIIPCSCGSPSTCRWSVNLCPPRLRQLSPTAPCTLLGYVLRIGQTWWRFTHHVSFWGVSHGNLSAPEELGTQIQRSHSTGVSALLRHRDSSELSILWQVLTFQVFSQLRINCWNIVFLMC